MRSDAGPITGAPWVWAGHVRAAWRLEEPTRAPAALPFPGVLLAPTPIAFYDSVAVSGGPSAGGLDGSLARARGGPAAHPRHAARSVIALRSGSFGIDESALGFERGDSALWVRAETSNSKRGGIGGWDGVARHVWGLGGGFARGAQAVSATFAQHGGAARLAGGEQESSSGESGSLAWRVEGARAAGGVTLARGHDFHESLDEALVYSRRDAQENRVRLWSRAGGGASDFAASLEYGEARIDRSYDGASSAVGRALWGRVAWARPVGEGRLALHVGAGARPHAGGVHLAPGFDYEVGGAGAGARVFFERITESVWADLAPGQAPFLQSTWSGGVAVHGGGADGGSAGEAAVRFGQTASRALGSRRPVDDLWLRRGFRADSGRYHFALLSARGAWNRGPLESAAEGFALVRDLTPRQPQVDPALGFRARLGTRFHAFTGDLGVRVRMLVEGVGPRESEAPLGRRLPGYVTLGAGVTLTLADATASIELLNLEDERRSQVWIDYATGREALGPGRTLRFLFTWRLFN